MTFQSKKAALPYLNILTRCLCFFFINYIYLLWCEEILLSIEIPLAERKAWGEVSISASIIGLVENKDMIQTNFPQCHKKADSSVQAIY